MTMRDYSEQVLVEEPAVALLEDLGWTHQNCFYETHGDNATLGRDTQEEVVLRPRLQAALQRLNPDLPPAALELAEAELVKDRSALHPVEANREVHRFLKHRVKVTFEHDGEQRTEAVRVIDWDNPANNDYFVASQFWIQGDPYKRRTDLLCFVNGLPLILIELKALHRNLKHAYTDNLRDYKQAIPQLFWYNAFIILSNGGDTRVGTMTAPWGHFGEWKKISSEEEPGVVSLETALRGTCQHPRLLDLVENFVLFSDVEGGLVKILAKYHQFLGVNNALDALRSLKENKGRLGVFWHTQGSGKSYSMIFFSQKALRKVPGDWTFLVVTDRKELDGQIYKNFAGAGVVTEPEQAVRAASSQHLRRLLRENHRYLFTLIHKFRTEHGAPHPVVSERGDIIVMTDEAHRTQYDILAKNMRDALPEAAFIGFTGTPLIAGEEKTKEVFGDYVSVYDFRQSWEDHATVPLFYENRIPELQLENQDFDQEMDALLEAAELDDAQEARLEREFGRQYHLITRSQRLERIAEDIVAHFNGRKSRGKAMVVCIDKATAVRMYDLVQKHWQAYEAALAKELETAADEFAQAELEERLAYLRSTDMAVVVSQSQNEVADMEEKGLDIRPHRQRLVEEDLETKFKKADDPLRMVFVCAMWMTGFDVPSCNTIYLDKPMRNHTLMQTIARANRVFPGKTNGLIVDYLGVFRNLQQALAIYGAGGTGDGYPVMPKAELVAALAAAIARAEECCTKRGVDLDAIIAAEGFERVRLLKDGAEALLENDDTKRGYLARANHVVRLFKAIFPDDQADNYLEKRNVLAVIAERIRSLTPQPDISGVMDEVEALLDRSVAAEAYLIRDADEEKRVDLSGIDFDAVQAQFASGRQRTEAERLRALVGRVLDRMVQRNRTRIDFKERLQQMIDDYNAGSLNIESFFKELLALAHELSEEEQRGIAEQLSEEELAIFDLLTKPEIDLTKQERKQVKAAARTLLATLKKERLVLDWRKRQQTRAQVQLTIQKALDEGLPEKFTRELYAQKCDAVYQHVYDSYVSADQSVYAA